MRFNSPILIRRVRGKMGKHSTGKYAKSRKGKIVAVIAIVLVIVAIITTVVIISLNNNSREIERDFNETFTGLKELDKEKVNQHMDYDKLISSLDEMILENPDDTELEKELFKNIEWTVESIEVEDNQATLIIEMTNKDFKTILTEWMKKIVKEKESQNIITNELALQRLKEIVSDESIQTKTVLKKVKIGKDEDSWKITVDNDLRDLVFPGIDSVVSAIGEK